MIAKSVTVGFDGYVDIITKPIKNTFTNDYFKTIKEFGEYIVSKADSNCSVEFTELKRKMGGNMPNFAYSLACKGVEVDAIGTLGEATEFDLLRDTCTVFSYSKEYTAHALEFTGGKYF